MVRCVAVAAGQQDQNRPCPLFVVVFCSRDGGAVGRASVHHAVAVPFGQVEHGRDDNRGAYEIAQLSVPRCLARVDARPPGLHRRGQGYMGAGPRMLIDRVKRQGHERAGRWRQRVGLGEREGEGGPVGYAGDRIVGYRHFEDAAVEFLVRRVIRRPPLDRVVWALESPP